MIKRTMLLGAALLAIGSGSAVAATTVHGPFAGTVHAVGTIDYKNATQKTWTWDRGRITAVSTGSITLLRRDGQSVVLAITAGTIVRNDGATYRLANLRLGQRATVISQDGAAVIIRRIRGEDAPNGADRSTIEGPARTAVHGTIVATNRDGSQQTYGYDRGRIVALQDGALTILRADGQQVSFTYDSSLLVRDHGRLESVADLHLRQRGTFFSQNGKLVLVRSHPGHSA
jgi:hypothetical protein